MSVKSFQTQNNTSALQNAPSLSSSLAVRQVFRLISHLLLTDATLSTTMDNDISLRMHQKSLSVRAVTVAVL